MAPMSVCLKILQMNLWNRIFYMSGSIKQIKTTGNVTGVQASGGNVSLSKFNLQTTEFLNPDSRKLAGFDVAWVEKWENFKLLTLLFCLFFRILSRISKENHLFKKSRGH